MIVTGADEKALLSFLVPEADFLSAALAYASCGLFIFPLLSLMKKPLY